MVNYKTKHFKSDYWALSKTQIQFKVQFRPNFHWWRWRLSSWRLRCFWRCSATLFRWRFCCWPWCRFRRNRLQTRLNLKLEGRHWMSTLDWFGILESERVELNDVCNGKKYVMTSLTIPSFMYMDVPLEKKSIICWNKSCYLDCSCHCGKC